MTFKISLVHALSMKYVGNYRIYLLSRLCKGVIKARKKKH